jgi:hypothetical protein
MVLTLLVAVATTSAPVLAATCPFGADGGAGIQALLDPLAPPPGSVVATRDCLADGSDSNWHSDGGSVRLTLSAEFAGFARFNEFGIYDPTSVAAGAPTRSLLVFSGAAAPGATAEFSIAPVVGGGFALTIDGSSPIVFGSNQFGFFLRTRGSNGTSSPRTFYGDTGLNADGFDHLAAYAFAGPATQSNAALLAWEDLPGDAADRDFDDLVVHVQGATPVPLQPAGWLFASGLAVLAVTRRRRSTAVPVRMPSG